MVHNRARGLRPVLVLALLAAALPARAQNQPHRTLLRNGMVVITKEVHDSHVLAVNVFVRGGAAIDPEETPGLANFTQRMLLQGTTRRTAEQIAEPIESIGGSIQSRADFDFSQLLLLCGADALDIGLDVLADVIRHPRFDPQAIEQERQQILATLTGLEDDPGWLIQRSLSQMIYARGPYARTVAGTAEAVQRISRPDLVNFHRRYYTPENLIVVIVGNIDRAAAEEKVTRLFGDMPASGRPPVTPAASSTSTFTGRGGNVVIKERNTELAHLAVGFPIGGVTRAEYPAILVMNSLLGGGMGSRLMREVREQQGLGYDLGSFYSQFTGPSYLAAYIKTDPIRMVFGLDGPYPTAEAVVNKAKDAILEQFEWVRDHPIPDAELERARRYTIGTFIYDHQRTLNQARYLGWFELVGLGYQYDNDLPQAVEAVTREDLQKLARKYFTRYAVALVMPEPKQADSEKQ